MGELHLVPLMSLTSEFELGMVREILRDNRIPFIIKDDGPGQYMRLFAGRSIYNTEVLVDEPYLEKAKELVIGVLGPGHF